MTHWPIDLRPTWPTDHDPCDPLTHDLLDPWPTDRRPTLHTDPWRTDPQQTWPTDPRPTSHTSHNPLTHNLLTYWPTTRWPMIQWPRSHWPHYQLTHDPLSHLTHFTHDPLLTAHFTHWPYETECWDQGNIGETHPYCGGSRHRSTLGLYWRVWSLVWATFIGFSLSLIAFFKSAINLSCIAMSWQTCQPQSSTP